jgi:phosphatidate cytidylyltransferase
MSGLPLRILSGLVGIFLILFSFAFGGATGLYLLCTLAFLLAGFECGTLLFNRKKDFLFLLPIHFCSFIAFLLIPNINIMFLFLILEVLIWVWAQRIQNKSIVDLYKQHSQLYVFLFFTLIAPTFLLGHLNSGFNPQSIFFLLFMVASFDTFSLFWGKLTGGRVFSKQLYPQSSPSKTIEGAAFAAITCTALTLVLDSYFPQYSIFYKIDNITLKIILSLLIFFAALTGDLAESLLKRAKNVKDSGRLFPGHGGFFDRLDGFLFAGFISYIILQF